MMKHRIIQKRQPILAMELDQLGEDGWELVSEMHSQGSDSVGWRYIFRHREVLPIDSKPVPAASDSSDG